MLKNKKRKALFICQIIPVEQKAGDASRRDIVKLLQWEYTAVSGEIARLGCEVIAAAPSDDTLCAYLKRVCAEWKYSRNPVCVCLPRQYATLRPLKIPSTQPHEIEKIVSLQAPKYLPYPAQDLITGYQVLSVDKEGYSNVNLIIVHKGIIQRYVNIFQRVGAKNLRVVLSSYGLCSLYRAVAPQSDNGVIIVDIDTPEAEIVIVRGDKLLVSRSCKLNRNQPDWHKVLLDQLRRTQEICAEENPGLQPEKIVIFGAGAVSAACAQMIGASVSLPVEVVDIKRVIPVAQAGYLWSTVL